MNVSINYPWGCAVNHDRMETSPGYDFGDPPTGHGYIGNDGQRHGLWPIHLRNDLREFQQIGIKSVRFAILFNGLTYGVNSFAPHENSTGWSFIPRALSDRFIADFRSFIQTFGEANLRGPRIQVIPVIAGFDFVSDPRIVLSDRRHKRHPNIYRPDQSAFSLFRDDNGTLFIAGRRAQALSLEPLPDGEGQSIPADFISQLTNDHTSQQVLSYQDAFLYHVLNRLLEEFNTPNGQLVQFRNVIHSWDVFAEPEMVTNPPTQRTDSHHPVANTAMHSYLVKAINLVRSHRFVPTIGFQKAATRHEWHWNLPYHLCQFHYYGLRNEHLPRVRPNGAAFIGEAATSIRNRFDPNFYEATGQQSSFPASLQDRLEWFEHLGYREVALWSAERIPPNELQSWTSSEKETIFNFVRNNYRTRRFRQPSY